MAIMNIAAKSAADSIKAALANKNAAQQDAAKTNAAMLAAKNVKAEAAKMEAAKAAAAAAKPVAPAAQIPPRPMGAQGNDMMMGTPKEGAGVTAATPRPLPAGVPAGGMPLSPVPAGIERMKANLPTNTPPGRKVLKKGGKVSSCYSSGGKVSSASKRGDGIAQRGKTKGRMV